MRALTLTLSGFTLTTLAWSCAPPPPVEVVEERTYVGGASCAECHAGAAALWAGSHHDLAMQEASPETVLGDFDDAQFTHNGVTSTFYRRGGKYLVRTDGPDGALADYEVAYTFGVTPLQQYLLPFPGGRYQALSIAWDTQRERWFHLYPDERMGHEDPLHWTKRFHTWNLMCAECHATAVDKGYDFARDSYETTWSELDVSCEACHGPGSRHVAWAREDEGRSADGNDPRDKGLAVSLGEKDGAVWVMDMASGLSRREPPRSARTEIETCARCHARRSSALADYVYGRPLLDTHRVSVLREPLYYPDGQIRDEVYVYGSFLQSEMYRQGVTCQDCHDPHSLEVRGEGNSICAACHLPERFDVASHHHHAADSEGALCVSCHMPATTYMVVDPRRDHSFRVPRPAASAASGSPNACNGCHREETPDWAEVRIAEWRGGERPDADEEPSAIARATELTLRPFDSRTRDALRDEDPLVRLAAVDAAATLEPHELHRLVVPLLEDDVRLVRLSAAVALASVPRELFTPEQWSQTSAGIAEYRAGQMRNADSPESHLNLGLLHAALGELDDAERAYRDALRVDAGFSSAYVNLADLYRASDRDREGEALLRAALGRSPDNPELLHALGLALVRTSRPGEAVHSFRRAAEARPDDARYAYVYGVALNSTGEPERAIEVLTEACVRHPGDRDILIALATMHRDRRNWERAITYANRLVQLSPDEPAPRRLLSELERARLREQQQ